MKCPPKTSTRSFHHTRTATGREFIKFPNGQGSHNERTRRVSDDVSLLLYQKSTTRIFPALIPWRICGAPSTVLNTCAQCVRSWGGLILNTDLVSNLWNFEHVTLLGIPEGYIQYDVCEG
ncbi:unnamed protein product [Mycena citricolor]|uniref:Uncharacterized protein n=1 Tax=Mycena citricolor TaxID=2018698 RepID=A0AAD2JW01_9AGAR|nr:unnamed protein product [Mycena citricolor]CAK5279571.1 unnamed protein product [Mycena citricolor]